MDNKTFNFLALLEVLLLVLFIGLKLTGNIDWSWTWVISPLWMSGAVTLCLIGLLAMVKFINKKLS